MISGGTIYFFVIAIETFTAFGSLIGWLERATRSVERQKRLDRSILKQTRTRPPESKEYLNMYFRYLESK